MKTRCVSISYRSFSEDDVRALAKVAERSVRTQFLYSVAGASLATVSFALTVGCGVAAYELFGRIYHAVPLILSVVFSAGIIAAMLSPVRNRLHARHVRRIYHVDRAGSRAIEEVSLEAPRVRRVRSGLEIVGAQAGGQSHRVLVRRCGSTRVAYRALLSGVECDIGRCVVTVWRTRRAVLDVVIEPAVTLGRSRLDDEDASSPSLPS